MKKLGFIEICALSGEKFALPAVLAVFRQARTLLMLTFTLKFHRNRVANYLEWKKPLFFRMIGLFLAPVSVWSYAIMLRTQKVAAALSFLLAVVSSGSLAADSDGITFAVPVQDPTSLGLIVPLPEIQPDDLVAEIRETQSALENRRLHYVEVAEDSRLTAGKVILALIVPGGLLMAAGSEMVHNHAEGQATSLEEEILALGEDLDKFESIIQGRRIILTQAPSETAH